MDMALGLALPGGVLLLLALGGYELRRKRRAAIGTRMLSTTYVDEVTALFYGTKRMELDHRDSTSMLRDDDARGGPPGPGVDLADGVARIPSSGGSILAAGKSQS